MKIRNAPLLAAMLLLASPLALAKEPVEQSQTQAARPANWATPVTIAGAPNLNRVDKNFYRSAQPEASGFQALAKDPGIKTVVSLRAFHTDKILLEGTGIKLIRVPIFTWHIETEDVVRALASIRKAETKGPVLLHCQHGADRTGLITAMYRILYQSWTKAAAIDEMQNGQFGYHAVWGNIPRYIRKIDVEALRKMVAKASV
jgi:protein tyrosine/serine phosphatase